LLDLQHGPASGQEATRPGDLSAAGPRSSGEKQAPSSAESGGKKRRLIIFRDTTEYPTGPVSFEDALNRELERRAYLAVRDVGKPQAVRGARRRRR
jgi:hypothetical protein